MAATLLHFVMCGLATPSVSGDHPDLVTVLKPGYAAVVEIRPLRHLFIKAVL